MTLGKLALVMLLLLPLLGIALLVIRGLLARTRKAHKRRPRSRDLIPAHIQERLIFNAKAKRLRRQCRNLFLQLLGQYGPKGADWFWHETRRRRLAWMAGSYGYQQSPMYLR